MDEVVKSKPSLAASQPPVSSGAGGANNTVTIGPAPVVQPQDLSQDSLLLTLPRITFNGANVPAVGGIALLSKLGQGGMGAVYYGIHPRLMSEVAVKILPFQLASQQPALIQRFYREARIAAKVKSSHLVAVTDVNEEHGLFYLVMEFVQGVSAGSHMRSLISAGTNPLDEATALTICIAAAEGLAVAHENGVIHRDIKPDNILIPKTRGDQLDFAGAKLADLGLARIDEGDSGLTASQSTMGTPGYMAPEQASDARTAGKFSDVFSLGATLYALVCGEPPFQESTPLSTILASIQKPHRPITNFRNDLTLGTSEVIERCLSKSPENRYPDAAALLNALRNCYAEIAPIGIPGASGTAATLVGRSGARQTSAGGVPSQQKTLTSPALKAPSSSVVDTLIVQPGSAQVPPKSLAPAKAGGKGKFLIAAAIPLAALIGYLVFRHPEPSPPGSGPDPGPPPPIKIVKDDDKKPDDPKEAERKLQLAKEAGAREATLRALQAAVKDATEAQEKAEKNFADLSQKHTTALDAETTSHNNLAKMRQTAEDAFKSEQAAGRAVTAAITNMKQEEAKLKDEEKLHGARPLLEHRALQPFKQEVESATKTHDSAVADLSKAKDDVSTALKAHSNAKTTLDIAKGALDAAQKDLDAARATAAKKKKDLQDFESSAANTPTPAPDTPVQNTIQGAYKLFDGPYSVEVADKIVLKDSARGKQIAVRVYYPKLATPKKCPVIIFSHGWPSTNEDYAVLSRFWCTQGFIVIHADSADSASGAEKMVDKLFEMFSDTGLFETRCKDVSFVLDSLSELKTQVPALKPLLDADHIAVAGHSIGAHVAELLAGVSVDLPNGEKSKSYADGRIKAVLLLSPPGRGAGGLNDNSWKSLKVPMLSVVGSLDHNKLHGADWRKDAFKLAPAGDKYQLLIDGAHHGLGGIMGTTPKGLDRMFGPDSTEQVDWIKTSSLAFFDAYLNNYAEAKAYLQSDALQKYGDGKFSFEKR